MKLMFRLICCFLLLASVAGAQQYPQYTALQLMDRVGRADTVYVVNFWATWCAPCVKELPAFDTLQQQFSGRPVKVLLVSLDFKEDYQERLNAFVKRKKTLPEVVWLSETNADKFIPEIDDRWSGAIPATLVLRGPQRAFFERTVTAVEMGTLVSGWLE
jgi:thiol-disulfide isomerase/thioredoxin